MRATEDNDPVSQGQASDPGPGIDQLMDEISLERELRSVSERLGKVGSVRKLEVG